MSTIHDALKKVQNDLNEKTEDKNIVSSETPPPQTPPAPPPPPVITPKKTPDPDAESPGEGKGVKIILILLGLIVCAALAGTIFLVLKKGLHVSDVLNFKTQTKAPQKSKK